MTNWKETSLDRAHNIKNFARNLLHPSIKLGITGLSKAGKTVFVTSLIHHLLNPSEMKFFEPIVAGRVKRIYLEPHPNDLLPRFDYEGNIEKLCANPPSWPAGTRRLSQLRLTIEYQRDNFLSKTLGPSKLHIDIIDYPGEWLLDLQLLEMSYKEWCENIYSAATEAKLKERSANWLNMSQSENPEAPLNEAAAKTAAVSFKSFLKENRDDIAKSDLLAPGRFLMPGDLEDAPALNFAPLRLKASNINEGTMAALMQRRFESYKNDIVRPFYRATFTRIERQIILVDLLTILNEGTLSLKVLQSKIANILSNYNPGANHWLTSIWNKRIDRLVFAATKADHLHHRQHDKIQTLMSHITQAAIQKAKINGADVKVQALASIRATTEIEIEKEGEIYPALRGTPMKGETLGGEIFDGKTEAIVFPGDLPEDIESFMQKETSSPQIEFINFEPPECSKSGSDKNLPPLPHIRLDRALNMLFGDKL